MKDLISKELLSLVIGEKISYIELKPKIGKVQRLFISHKEENYEYEERLNLDTLGRLMKEWCHIKGFLVKIHYPLNRVDIAVSVAQDNSTIFGEKEFIENTELEAIIKATEWVAKEKGLLCTH